MNAYAMPKIGDVIAAKYRLEKVAGEGGMGIVYAAEHLVLKQRVAVKVLLPDAASSDAVVERFAREARAAAKINSEHVARVMDAGSLASGAPFLVMEYLEGCDLEELLELQESLPVAEVVDYLLQALEGLAHAHAVNIVHRDLKPANLFLACRPDGGNISKAMKSTQAEKRLTGQHVLGSPVYMSPEQLRNAKDIDGRADLWSLGVVAYELLAGEVPFDGDGVGEIFAAILERAPKPLHERSRHVSPELSSIITKCLQREPADRWTDAAELAQALAPFGTGAAAAAAERAQHVLARAKLLKGPSTPLETRKVVEAIDAAAERARTTGIRTAALPLVHRRLDSETIAENPLRKKRSGALVGLAAALVFSQASIAIVFAVRGSGAAAAPRSDHDPTQQAAPDPGQPTATAPSTSGEPAIVIELPANPNAPAGRRTTKQAPPAKASARPKFLNSRE
jgi:eukaryotic-like serine/threonine-protein kinase